MSSSRKRKAEEQLVRVVSTIQQSEQQAEPPQWIWPPIMDTLHNLSICLKTAARDSLNYTVAAIAQKLSTRLSRDDIHRTQDEALLQPGPQEKPPSTPTYSEPQKRQKVERDSKPETLAAPSVIERSGLRETHVDKCATKEDARNVLDAFWTPKPIEDMLDGRPTIGKIEPAPYPPESEDPIRRPRFVSSTQPLLRNSRLDNALCHRLPTSIPKPTASSKAPYGKSNYGLLSLSRSPDAGTSGIEAILQNLHTDDPELPQSDFKSAEKLEREQVRSALRIEEARKARFQRRYPKVELVQALPAQWNDRVTAQYSIRPEVVITKSIGGTPLRLHDFQTLLGHRSWLNDEIINAYVEWITDAANKAAEAQAKEWGEPEGTVPKFIAHNSFFYKKLLEQGPKSAERLMKRIKAPMKSLLEVDSMFVPICSGNHWTLGVVRPIAKTIEYFDSMGGHPSTFFRLMRSFLAHQLGSEYVASDWKEPNTRCARQNNGYDCGVFLCTNAFCVAFGLNTDCYEEEQMTQQRRNIAAVLINKGFQGDFAWDKLRELAL